MHASAEPGLPFSNLKPYTTRMRPSHMFLNKKLLQERNLHRYEGYKEEEEKYCREPWMPITVSVSNIVQRTLSSPVAYKSLVPSIDTITTALI